MTANPTAPATPVQHPTWYANVRGMFRSPDISCMRGQGIDLASYADVSDHAGDIYQQVAEGNMPMGGPAWTSDKVATFKNWMDDGYPKGTPMPIAIAQLAASNPNLRTRKDITTLSGPELDKLKAAFTAIMAREPSDPNSYFAQAAIHWYPAPNTYCMHHVPGYNPWHRAYMLSFENALRSVPGCEDVTLPYWDITTPFPDILKNPPFDKYVFQADVGPDPYSKGYVTNRNDYATIEVNLQRYKVTEAIARALTKTDWEDFHGYFAEPAPAHNTIIFAHDAGHDSIGPTMGDQDVAAFDPVFWFFHCNWDRLFWKWQTLVQGTVLNGLISTIDKNGDETSYQIFTDAALESINPFSAAPLNLKTTDVIDSVNSLNVQYTDPPAAAPAQMVAKTEMAALASRRFTVDTSRVNVRVKGINRLKIPGTFRVHLLKDGKEIARAAFFQPSEVEKCATCAENAIATFDFELPIEQVGDGQFSVQVEPTRPELVKGPLRNKDIGDPRVEVCFILSG
ncbi:MAG TPA: tyrosinase family protein [Fimbriimonadaceae bacterium]|nr:tyrosinase family protein [Fimbriimonadaceae bacterium]